MEERRTGEEGTVHSMMVQVVQNQNAGDEVKESIWQDTTSRRRRLGERRIAVVREHVKMDTKREREREKHDNDNSERERERE